MATLLDGALHVAPDGDAPRWSIAMSWTGLGRGDALAEVGTPTHVATQDNRASYHRADGSEEWFLNGPLGIEQGFELSERAPGEGDLHLALHIDGDLRPVAADQRVDLVDDDGRAVLRYSDLFVRDADGAHVEASLSVVDSTIVLSIDDDGAHYPLSVDPLLWVEVKKLTASDAQQLDYFGVSVAVSGDTAVVGAYAEDTGGTDAGAAYVFSRDQGGADNWGQVQKLIAGDAQAFDRFGASVAVSGDTAVVGAQYERTGGAAAGAAYVFSRDQGGADNWGQVQKLTAGDTQAGDQFGISVAVSGDTAVVGAYGEDTGGSSAGAAYVFSRDQGGTDNWGQLQKLRASDAEAGDGFGYSVAVSGDTAVVGAPFEGTGGAAYVFLRDQGGADSWGQLQKLTASDAQAGDELGISVAVSGDTAVVGAHREDHGAAFEVGAAYVFSRDRGGVDNWGQVQKLTASDGEGDDYFGSSVAVSGDMAVVGAYGQDTGAGLEGAAYVFSRDQGGADNWGQLQELTANDAESGGYFGNSVAASGGIVVVGAFEVGSAAGAAYVVVAQHTLGEACSSAGRCRSGFCVDGVCCEDACGGGDEDDCLACSITAGSPVNGACAVRLDGAVCSDGAFCNGSETCAAGVCGGSAGDPCGGPDGDDDCKESCDEATDSCTASDPYASACDDGLFCNGSETCSAGVCGNSTGDPCPGADGDANCAENCDELTNTCTMPDADATSCTDQNACTQTDSCMGGVCQGTSPVTCTASDPCHDPGVCDPGTGTCSDPAKADGTSCSDGDLCTQQDSCQSGTCTAGNAVSCVPLDTCHDAGTCDSATGACSHPEKPDGTACPGGGTCDAGVCIPASSGEGGSSSEGGGGATGGSSGEGGAQSGGGGAQSGEGGSSAAGCATDNDCKGDRVCTDGQCADPDDGGCSCSAPGKRSSSPWPVLAFGLLVVATRRRRSRSQR